MKKCLSIFLLLMMLFNIVGYKIWFYYMEVNASVSVEQRLDKMQDDGRETLIIKIPINLPYQTNSSGFERVDGEMTYKGTTYKYFKRKIYNDSLIMVCVKFKEKNVISGKSDDWFKNVNDIAANAAKKQLNKQPQQDDYFQPVNISIVGLFIKINRNSKTNEAATHPCSYADNKDMPPRMLVNII